MSFLLNFSKIKINKKRRKTVTLTESILFIYLRKTKERSNQGPYCESQEWF